MGNKIVTMTFDEYDRMMEEFQKLHLKTRWPALDDMEILESDIQRFLPYACYLDGYGETPRNKDEEYRKRTLRLFIQEHMELVD